MIFTLNANSNLNANGSLTINISGIIPAANVIVSNTVVIANTTIDLRPANAPFNITTDKAHLANYLANIKVSESSNASYFQKVDGNFAGTTQDIIAHFWTKWFPEFPTTYAYAQAQNESGWIQTAHGDLEHVTTTEPNGGSWGIMQIAEGVNQGWPATYPCSHLFTGFNCDYCFGYERMVYDGYVPYLSDPDEPKPVNGATPYGTKISGIERLLGAMGVWYSGHWYNAGAITYINQIKTNLTNAGWTKKGF